jgi:hypothetical protein
MLGRGSDGRITIRAEATRADTRNHHGMDE